MLKTGLKSVLTPKNKNAAPADVMLDESKSKQAFKGVRVELCWIVFCLYVFFGDAKFSSDSINCLLDQGVNSLTII